MYLYLYVTLMYTVKTRLPTLPRFISWLIIYLIPVSLSYLYFSPVLPNTSLLFKSLLGILLIYTLYEIGYIYNDTETVKNEVNPTMRLSAQSLKHYEKYKKFIYLSKFITACFLSLAIYFLYGANNFIIVAWFIIPLYIIYNLVRSRVNLPIHFLLVCVRFCSPLLLFTNQIPIVSFIMMVTIFPIINTLERCAEKRFNLPKLQKNSLLNRKNGRYKYYGMLCLLAIGLCVIQYKHVNQVFLGYSIYFFLYRFVTSRVTIK